MLTTSLVVLGLGVVHAATVWPQPAHEVYDTTSSVLLSSSFKFVDGSSSKSGNAILKEGMARYETILAPSKRGTAADVGAGTVGDHAVPQRTLDSLTIIVANTAVDLEFGVNESYILVVNNHVATLKTPTVFGALRGLETFVQLAIHSNTYTPGALSVPVAVLVEDEPRFAYRGLMMDYSRHFYPVDFIEHTMDAMAASKLNVLHMHITDDESFPIESTSVPELTAKGSYPGYVYTHADIARLSDYATARGILLIPEFDMPAHSSAWGAGVPEMMVQGCSPEMFAHGDTMNPTVPETFAVLNKVLGEMSDLFQKPFLHLGGDEVPTSCWLGNKTITSWMKEHGMTTADELESYFVNKVAQLPAVVESGRTLIYWEEIFNNNVTLPNNTIIQGWKSNAIDATAEEIALIIGGETTMWGECVDAVNFDGVVWPRAAAAAEQLWTPQVQTKANAAGRVTAMRLAEHRCRLVGRGVGAAPLDSSATPRIVNPGCQ
eukprot:gene3624-6188_t